MSHTRCFLSPWYLEQHHRNLRACQLSLFLLLHLRSEKDGKKGSGLPSLSLKAIWCLMFGPSTWLLACDRLPFNYKRKPVIFPFFMLVLITSPATYLPTAMSPCFCLTFDFSLFLSITGPCFRGWQLMWHKE